MLKEPEQVIENFSASDDLHDQLPMTMAAGVLGLNIYSHYTIRRHDYIGYAGNGMTYGGIHETREQAEQARIKLIEKEGQVKHGNVTTRMQEWLSQRRMQEWEENSEIVELQEGEKYDPWGASVVRIIEEKQREIVHYDPSTKDWARRTEPYISTHTELAPAVLTHGVNDGTHSDLANKDNVFFLQNGGAVAIPWRSKK